VSETQRFLIIDDLFDRYTIVVTLLSRDTSVWCEECEQFVAEYDEEQLTTRSEEDFYMDIVEKHAHDFPDRVSFKEEIL